MATTKRPTAPKPAPAAAEAPTPKATVRTVLFCPSVGDELIAEILDGPTGSSEQCDLRLHIKGDDNDPDTATYRDYLNVRRDYRRPGHMMPGTWQPVPEVAPVKSYPPPPASATFAKEKP
jgi:hypothetical protein